MCGDSDVKGGWGDKHIHESENGLGNENMKTPGFSLVGSYSKSQM